VIPDDILISRFYCIQKKEAVDSIPKRKDRCAAEFGHSPAENAKKLKRPVRTTIKLDLLRHEGETRRRNGQPCEYDERDVRKLVDTSA
jgi:hypothetical protein